MAINPHGADIDTLAAVIAHSQIVVAGPPNLPAGFGHVDIAILDWIVYEGRRGHSVVRM
jgi:hypothetical protein